MTNYESGKFVAQVFSHDISRLLEKIYEATVEPKRELNDFEKGVIEETSTWVFKSGRVSQLLLKLETKGENKCLL